MLSAIVKSNSARAAQSTLRACDDGNMSSSSEQVSGRETPYRELLADPYAALGIASHESDLWRTHASIELASETEATVTITMKGRGETDRLRLDLVQLP